MHPDGGVHRAVLGRKSPLVLAKIYSQQTKFTLSLHATIQFLHFFFNENQDVKKCDHCITFKLLTFLKKET